MWSGNRIVGMVELRMRKVAVCDGERMVWCMTGADAYLHPTGCPRESGQQGGGKVAAEWCIKPQQSPKQATRGRWRSGQG